MKRDKIPDILTFIRLGGALPVMVILYLQFSYPALRDLKWLNILLFVIFWAFASTDFFDGLIARRIGVTSSFGILFDPVADKVIILGPLIILLQMDRGVHLLPVLIMVLREIIITGLRSVAAARGMVIKASPLGKSKMLFQELSVGFFIIEGIRILPFISTKLLAQIFLWTAMAVSVISGLEYFLGFLKFRKGETNKRQVQAK